MVDAIIEQLEHYIMMVETQLKIAKESLAIAKSKKDAGVMAIVKACSQMEDHNNHFHEAKEALQTLITKLENSSVEEKEDLHQQINT